MKIELHNTRNIYCFCSHPQERHAHGGGKCNCKNCDCTVFEDDGEDVFDDEYDD